MSEKKNHTILIIDDDADIRSFIAYNLENNGFKVLSAENGAKGLELVKVNQPELILLDVMMPEMDGVEICNLIRENKEIKQPVIAFLTARSEDYSQIAGFDAGADDYITKPVRPRVLLSRVQALLRRSYVKSEEKTQNKDIFLDRERFILNFKGEEIQLPKKEFELLELLVNKPGKVFTRDKIMSVVWGDETIVGERTIDVHIRKLREKIGDEYIRTIKGVGYTFKDS